MSAPFFLSQTFALHSIFIFLFLFLFLFTMPFNPLQCKHIAACLYAHSCSYVGLVFVEFVATSLILRQQQINENEY